MRHEYESNPARTTNVGPCAGIPRERLQSVHRTFDRVGEKWSLRILAVLGDGPQRYSDLQLSTVGISTRMLTLTVSRLHRHGLVSRISYPEVPPRVEYSITPLGRGLLDIAMVLTEWAADNHEQIDDARESADS